MTDTDPAELLAGAARSLRTALADAPLTQAERAYLASTATRLDAYSERLRSSGELEPEPALRRPEAYYTRTEAARLLKLAPNTLINWEQRGLLRPARDHRGWRVYSRDDLARALALAAHVPVDELAAHGR